MTPSAKTRTRSILGLPRAAFPVQRSVVNPFPLSAVRLAPSPWLRAVEANRVYLHRLDPDLAAREGIFALTNPGHVLFGGGIAIIVAGALMFFAGRALTTSHPLAFALGHEPYAERARGIVDGVRLLGEGHAPVVPRDGGSTSPVA